MRYFNTAGPVNCRTHYCLPPIERIDLERVVALIDQQKYFVLHAPRQTGKTSALLALAEHLNRQGRYVCLYAIVEKGQSAREDVQRGMHSILAEIASRARDFLDDTYPLENMRQVMDLWGADSALNEMLSGWCKRLEKPLVLLIDEIDSLVGDTLVSTLRQIRAGYDKKPALFPQSIVLCGVRDVRDYRIHSSREKTVVTGGSTPNVKAESLRMGNFGKEEIAALYSQHTYETGQRFDPGVFELIWEYAQGQPWLVNALACETCFNMEEGRDRSKPIIADLLVQAKENLILRRETHLDQLADKLREPRMRSVIEPLLTGTPEPGRIAEDDIQYLTDLGLIRRKPQQDAANAIYKEIIPRMLVESTQDMLPFQTQWYVAPDGRLDSQKLLAAFQDFFREHSEHWVERFDYKEAGPPAPFASVPATDSQLWRPNRPRIRPGKKTDRSDGRMETRRKRPENRDGIEDRLQEHRKDPARRTPPNCAIHGHLRLRRRPPHRVRPGPGKKKGGQDLQKGRNFGRKEDRGVGDVSWSGKNAAKTWPGPFPFLRG